MLKNLCKDCGMILPADTKVCSVCGFDNEKDQSVERSTSAEYFKNASDNVAPSYYSDY